LELRCSWITFFARDVEVPLYLFAVAISAWYGRTTGAVLALALSCLTFDYFFGLVWGICG
jgi:K+-sensing histidine kinase KdpD